MSKVAKYRNIFNENMEVTVEAIGNRLIGVRATSRVSNLRKDK